MFIARQTQDRLSLELERKRHDLRSPSRRVDERLPAVEDHVWMQWLDQGEYLGRSARLVNVSRGGAMITTSALLKSNQIIHLFLEYSEPQIGVKAQVLEVLEGKKRVHQVRLAFPEGCPDSFREAASIGFETWLRRKREIERSR